MKLHNTLTRKTEELKPLDGKTIRIYSCGPTVYDHAHIGNLSAYIFADTLRRTTELTGYDVKQVMNYTDIDDKTIRRSHERYPDDDRREALRKLTEHYIKVFLEDMELVGNQTRPITFMRATDNIDGMKALITKLHQGGFAYIADDGVYFSIEAYRKSGKTYGQLLELTTQNTSAARISNDEYDKDSVHDFALWKKQKDDEPAWEFTLDGQDMTGRPGWHIECSVMSRKGLGQPFDIHTGGVDLIFPHHENEIAQSTAGEDDPVMAQFFAHNDHILVDGKKMAKSAGNFHTLQDITDKGYDPLAFRLLVLQAHYRSQVNFTWESLDAAQNRLKALRAMADLKWQVGIDSRRRSQDTVQANILDKAEYEIRQALENDIDTPTALASLSTAAKQWLKILSTTDENAIEAFLKFVDDAFGLDLGSTQSLTNEQQGLIDEREAAQQNKDWAKSDDIRKELTEQGIGLRDTPQGPVWFRL